MRSTSRNRTRLTCTPLENREVPSASWQIESFNTTPVGTLPSGWSQWTNASNIYAASSGKPYSGPTGLAANGTSTTTGRSYRTESMPKDTAVSSTVFIDSLIPTDVLARGQNLGGSTPTFYAASITRGLNLQIVKVANGVRTTLASVASTSYVSSQWVKVTLTPTGSTIAAQVQNLATGQYLTSTGGWSSTAVNALTVTDGSITADGQVGLNRPAAYSGTINIDDFGTMKPDASARETFDTTTAGLPNGWSQLGTTFSVGTGRSLSPSRSLISSGTSAQGGFAWLNSASGSDVEVSTAVYADSLIPAVVVARGSNLHTKSPTYYGLVMQRGLQLSIVKVVNGVSTTLASGISPAYFANQWVRITLEVQGSTIKAHVMRTDTNQSLNSSGQWVSGDAVFRQVTDSGITSGGLVGVGRLQQYAGSLYFDDFIVESPGGDVFPPVVTVTAGPAPGNTVGGVATFTVSATDAAGVQRVEFWLDGALKSTVTTAPYSYQLDTNTVANGGHSLVIRAYDAAGNVGQTSRDFRVSNTAQEPPPTPGVPSIPRHYSHIRVAQLAYYGTPITSFETSLLQNSIDLVIPNPAYLGQINSVAPNTPQLIYTNFSNLYQGLLTDWLTYADSIGADRESAFYHVTQPSAWTGNSPSSQPVTWFWNVRKGTSDYTTAARSTNPGDVPFGVLGESVSIGFPDKFREININLSTAGSGGWAGVWEYASAVDVNGLPTAWSTLNTVTNTTNGMTQSGQITFDPPSNWKAASLAGEGRLFYVRLRTTSNGTVPHATTVMGRDYVGANGGTSGTIPAFDSAADSNGDGYLNNTEYANRSAGKDARFRSETRLFYPYYGQMRFVTNPSSPSIRAWAVDFHERQLAANPLADGFFVDNSAGKLPFSGVSTAESTANYAVDTGTMLQQVNAAIAPKWLMVNTSGGNSQTNEVVARVPAAFEEFLLRPMANNYINFFDTAGLVASRLSTANSPYIILDSHPQGGSPTDPRTQIATLAYYYLVADPNRTMLMFYGGYEPASSWTRHWTQAAAYNVGQPTGSWSEFATGLDPSNSTLTYKVLQRNYSNALVLYKPLSYKTGTNGTAADATATTHALGGTYRLLNADGTLGSPITSISLRNAEAAILIRV